MNTWIASRKVVLPTLWACASLLTACSHHPTVPAGDAIGTHPAPVPDQAPATSSPPQGVNQQLPSIELQGQMSLKLQAFGAQPAKGLSLGFFFSGHTQSGQLDLMTLLGSQMARVEWQTGQAWLTNEKGRRHFGAIEELAEEALGEALPLRALIHWMQGHPDPQAPHQTGPEAGTFTQLGWTIDARELPIKKLLAQRHASDSQRGVTIKVYLDR